MSHLGRRRGDPTSISPRVRDLLTELKHAQEEELAQGRTRREALFGGGSEARARAYDYMEQGSAEFLARVASGSIEGGDIVCEKWGAPDRSGSGPI